ncbi:MAG TPA: Type 1 glutamine amidotransferase-like domain-containing protein [Patescibacteria group bacterium]|nr:Type 1 glutamine amidotransferase-like domain-containing protein [Patescibacteria group bacterium]
MKLFLASEVKNPESIKKLEEYIGGFEGKSIAYIPTAANGESGWESWKESGSWKLLQTLPVKVKLVQLEEYRSDSVIKEIVGKDIVWFAGGMAGYLMYWVRRCRLDQNLKDVLDKGTLYVGSSAGSMVAGQSLEIASWSFIDEERGSEYIKPLGLVDFDIYPHYEESLYEKIKKNYKGNKLYLLKNGEEIIVEDGKITVVGEERIISND